VRLTHRGTLTSQLRTKLGNRRCERLLVETELWAATLGREADIDDLWRAVLTQQFHDILPGSSIAWVHADAEAEFERVEAALEAKIAGLLDDLAPRGFWLANPSDSPISGVAVLAGLPAEVARDVQGQELADGTTAVVVDAPAIGLAAAEQRASDDRVVVTESSMVNHRLAVRWDAAGNISSIIDLATAREIVPRESLAAVLELAIDQPVEYDAWDLERWTRAGAVPLTSALPPDGAVSVEVVDEGPLVGRVRVTRSFGPSTVALTYELRAEDRQLLIHVDLDWRHDEHLLSIAFPLDVRADTAACDVQFGVVRRPTHPSSPWDAAKFEVCAHRFVDLSEPSFGVAVLNDGRYGHCVFDGAVRVSLARAAKYPDPRADRGRHTVTLAVRPHDGDLAVVRAAASRLNRPARAVLAGAAAVLPAPVVAVLDGAGSSAPGVEIDAVKLADDAEPDIIVRLPEACGDRTAITVRTPSPIGAAWRCNLLEEPLRGEEVGDGVVSMTLRPFELVTLRLQTEVAGGGQRG
jgi:alpha-mannosidase